MPKVSVVIPLYNGAAYFPQAIESILNQSLSDLECIVVEDGSEDASPDLLRSYAKRDRRIRPVFLKKNIGTTRATQRGLEESKASLVARMDADDFSLPSRLQKQYDYLQKHENIGLLGCGFFRFMEDEKGCKRMVGSLRSSVSEDQEEHRYRTGRPPLLCCASGMFCRKIALQAGGYRGFFVTGAEDRDFVLRMQERMGVATLAEPLYAYRVNPKSSFRKNRLGVKAGSIMATYCALRRRSGKEDPLEQAKPLSRLPQVLGLPSSPSLCLKDLQQDPRWITELLFRWLEEKPFDKDTCARLYLGLVGNYLSGRGGWHRGWYRALACVLCAIRLDGRLTVRLAVRFFLTCLSWLALWHRDFWRQRGLEKL